MSLKLQHNLFVSFFLKDDFKFPTLCLIRCDFCEFPVAPGLFALLCNRFQQQLDVVRRETHQTTVSKAKGLISDGCVLDAETQLNRKVPLLLSLSIKSSSKVIYG